VQIFLNLVSGLTRYQAQNRPFRKLFIRLIWYFFTVMVVNCNNRKAILNY
jgi:hypothetical protein